MSGLLNFCFSQPRGCLMHPLPTVQHPVGSLCHPMLTLPFSHPQIRHLLRSRCTSAIFLSDSWLFRVINSSRTKMFILQHPLRCLFYLISPHSCCRGIVRKDPDVVALSSRTAPCWHAAVGRVTISSKIKKQPPAKDGRENGLRSDQARAV